MHELKIARRTALVQHGPTNVRARVAWKRNVLVLCKLSGLEETPQRRRPVTAHRPVTLTPAANAAPRQAWDQAVQHLQQRLAKGVRLELREQQRQQQAAYNRSSERRLQTEGLMLRDLVAQHKDRHVGCCDVASHAMPRC